MFDGMRRLPAVAVIAFLLALSAFAADPKIERIGPFGGSAPAALKAALEETGYRVTGEDGRIMAEIWPAKLAAIAKSDNSNALYPDFVSGAFYGVITFPSGAGDFRGQKIPAGTYQMRYQLLPGDGNHLGVAPNPDFFLLVSVEADPDPSAKIAFAALVRLSAKASGTAHPAVFALSAPGAHPFAVNQEQGHTIAYFPIKTATTSISIGMILSGSAEQ
jgi:hypothetical protein